MKIAEFYSIVPVLDLAAAYLNFDTWFKLSGQWESIFIY